MVIVASAGIKMLTMWPISITRSHIVTIKESKMCSYYTWFFPELTFEQKVIEYKSSLFGAWKDSQSESNKEYDIEQEDDDDSEEL